MSKSNNLTDFLTDVANSLRVQTGKTDKINPQAFSAIIDNLPVLPPDFYYAQEVGDGQTISFITEDLGSDSTFDADVIYSNGDKDYFIIGSDDDVTYEFTNNTFVKWIRLQYISPFDVGSSPQIWIEGIGIPIYNMSLKIGVLIIDKNMFIFKGVN